MSIVVDGTRAYEGRVVDLLESGVLVDFGCERQGFLPAARGCTRAVGAVAVTRHVRRRMGFVQQGRQQPCDVMAR